MKRQTGRRPAAPTRRAPARRPLPVLSPVGMVLLLMMAVVMGWLLPGVTAAIQERSTDRLEQTVDLGQASLSLTSDEGKLEKLRIVGEMLSGRGDSLALNTEGRFMTAADASDKFYDVVALLEGSGLSVGQLTRTDVVAAFPILLVSDSGTVATSMAWAVEAWRSAGGSWYSLDFVVDDATGLILSVEYNEEKTVEGQHQVDYSLTEWDLPDWSGTAQQIMENLSRSYAFTDTTMTLSGGANLNRLMRMYYVNYSNSQGTVLGLPIVIGRNSWAINYYEGLRGS